MYMHSKGEEPNGKQFLRATSSPLPPFLTEPSPRTLCEDCGNLKNYIEITHTHTNRVNKHTTTASLTRGGHTKRKNKGQGASTGFDSLFTPPSLEPNVGAWPGTQGGLPRITVAGASLDRVRLLQQRFDRARPTGDTRRAAIGLHDNRPTPHPTPLSPSTVWTE